MTIAPEGDAGVAPSTHQPGLVDVGRHGEVALPEVDPRGSDGRVDPERGDRHANGLVRHARADRDRVGHGRRAP